MNTAEFSNLGRERFLAGILELGHKWGWYLGLGIFLILLGAAATGSSVYTTLFSVIALGWVLMFAGAGLIVLSFLTGRWGTFLFSLAAGLLSLMAGTTLVRAPLAGAATLTLAIALFLMVSGAFRAIASAVVALPNWGWSFASGVLTFILGVFLFNSWQAISLVFIGFFVGIDLITHGFAWCMFAVAVRRLKRVAEGKERRAA